MSAQKNKQNIATYPKTKPTQDPTQTKSTLFDRLDDVLSTKMELIQWTGLAISLLLAGLLFEYNVSTAGDDSMYIENAWHFLKEGTLPVYKGTLYSVLLSGFIAIFGINIPVLKLFSLVLIVGSLYFYFNAIRHRVAPLVSVAAFGIITVCSYYLYFASQTYSEALYLFLQALLIFLALRYYEKPGAFNLRNDLRKALAISLVAFLLFLTRNIGIVSIAVIILYLFIQKQWKRAITIALAFMAIFALFSLIKHLIWGTEGVFGGSQFTEVAYKNLYNEQMGKEDVHGFVHRFLVNSNNFFSKHLYMFMGFRGEHVQVIPMLATLMYALIVVAFYCSFKMKSRIIQYLSIHVILLCLGTFIALQEEWDQWRQILVYYPYILILLAYLAYEILKKKKYSGYQWLFPALFGLIFCTTVHATLQKIPDTTDRLGQNLNGNVLYGMAPDWQNYILSSVWAAENLPKQHNIAVRKPNISFIYGRRNFYGIFRLDGSSYETIKNKLKPGYKSVILSMPDAVVKGLYPSIAKYTICVIAGSITKTANMPPPGTLVLYNMPVDTLAKYEVRFRATKTQWIPDGLAWLDNQPLKENIFYYDPDLLLNELIKNDVRYFILASLRINPADINAGIIDTLHKYFMVIEIKYPGSIRLLHEDGKTEKASVCELHIPTLRQNSH